MEFPMPTHPHLLVDPAWLQARLDDPAVRVLECTTHLHPQPVGPSRIVSGLPEFLRDRIPGARYVNMATDMSDPGGRYPYTLLSEAQAEARLAALGIGDAHHVVLYARGGMMSAARVWFVLHALGHERVSLLDGGYERWVAEARPVERGPVAAPDKGDRTADAGPFAPGAAPPGAGPGTVPPGSRFTARLQAHRVADLEAVRAALDDPAVRLVNALSREQFLGTGGAHYGRPGSIPGSVNVPARELVSPQTGRFLDRAELEARFARAGVLDAPRAIVYCGGGVAATVVAFALETLGHPGWSVYDNSLLEWSTIAEMPMVPGRDA
jgi:thiosulfate/3-mercaptopyruvate sulfurtransferase